MHTMAGQAQCCTCGRQGGREGRWIESRSCMHPASWPASIYCNSNSPGPPRTSWWGSWSHPESAWCAARRAPQGWSGWSARAGRGCCAGPAGQGRSQVAHRQEKPEWQLTGASRDRAQSSRRERAQQQAAAAVAAAAADLIQANPNGASSAAHAVPSRRLPNAPGASALPRKQVQPNHVRKLGPRPEPSPAPITLPSSLFFMSSPHLRAAGLQAGAAAHKAVCRLHIGGPSLLLQI